MLRPRPTEGLEPEDAERGSDPELALRPGQSFPRRIVDPLGRCAPPGKQHGSRKLVASAKRSAGADHFFAHAAPWCELP
jgi:hypothetical protein